MSTWDRTNRLELDLRLAQREIDKLTKQRDLARSLAASLEGENAELQAELEAALTELQTAPLDVVMVPVRGEAT